MRQIKIGSRGEDVKAWQSFLLSRKYRIGRADGVFGRNTQDATKHIQRRNRLKADGIVGPRTWALVPKNMLPQTNAPTRPTSPQAPTTPTNKWPKQDYVSMVNYFGPVGENQTRVDMPYPLVLAWDSRTTITRMTCNQKVAESVYTIFENTLKVYGEKDIKKLKLDAFGGCLNVRKMRGGSSWSIHSWGTAIDLDPDRNQLRWGRDRAVFARKEYDEFWKIVEKEGWVSLGRARNFDWMHFQAALL